MEKIYQSLLSHKLTALTILVVSSVGMDFIANPEIAKSIEEGEEVIRQLEALLSDPNYPKHDKLNIKSSVNALVRKGHHADLDSFPLMTRSADSNPVMFNLTNRDCDTICCKVVPPLAVLSSQRTVYHTCQRYYTHHTSQSCGLFGWARCGASRSVLESYTCSSVVTDYYTEQRSCPSDMYTCCAGQVQHQACCLFISELKEIIDEAMKHRT